MINLYNIFDELYNNTNFVTFFFIEKQREKHIFIDSYINN